MDLILSTHEQKKPYLIAPEVAGIVFRQMTTDDNVRDYPEDFFYPYNPYDPDRNTTTLMFSDITENTYAIHHWGKSWSQNIFSRAIKKAMNLIRSTT
ncbi:hypothetical protein D3C84_1170740 [compost metagenome]